MQQTTTHAGKPETAQQTIPAHVLERLENEWRQMRQSAAQPSAK
ncbi:hypothetical protein [Peteryoungia desertarenae]|nr:hypothetical protein [Peteryoungia desertarenae]